MRFLKQVVDDDGAVIASIPYRATAKPGASLEKAMEFADERLSLKHAPVENKEWFNKVTGKK